MNMKMILGHREIKQYHRFEEGKMVTYGYSIDFDQNGVEIGRTEPTPISSIGWDSGKPFTESDYRSIASGQGSRPGILGRLFGRR